MDKDQRLLDKLDSLIANEKKLNEAVRRSIISVIVIGATVFVLATGLSIVGAYLIDKVVLSQLTK